MNEITTGSAARSILDDETFTKAISAVREDIMEIWAESPSHDDVGREACYRELHALKSVIHKLRAYVDAGVIKAKEK